MTTATSTQPYPHVRLHITLHSLAFVLGLSLVFVSMGFGAGFVGDLVSGFQSVSIFGYETTTADILRTVAGLVLILFGLLMLKVVPLPFLQREFRFHLANRPAGYLGSVLVGMAFGAGWTPCIGPILGGILTIAANGGAAQGAILLGFYTLGFAIPFLVAAQTLTLWRRLNRYVGVIERVGAVLLILVGVVLITNVTEQMLYAFPALASMTLETRLSASPTGQPSLWIAFIAGTLSFLSPCVLPILPSFLAYLTGMNAQELLNPDAQS